MVPTWMFFVEPVLKALSAANGPLRRADLVNTVIDSMKLTPDDLTEMAGSTKYTKAQHRSAWALSYASMGGLAESPSRSQWQITAAGRALLAKHPNGIPRAELKKLVKVARREVDAGSEAAAPTIPEAASSESTPVERLQAAHAEILQSVRDLLLNALRAVSPSRFEDIVLDLLHAAGYGGSREQLRKTAAGADGGIDGIISLDRLGLEKVYVQAKRYAADNAVTRPTIQSFLGALSERRASKGVFITTSRFSKEARECAARSSDSLVLLDGQELADLMIERRVGLAVKESFALLDLDSDYFEDA